MEDIQIMKKRLEAHKYIGTKRKETYEMQMEYDDEKRAQVVKGHFLKQLDAAEEYVRKVATNQMDDDELKNLLEKELEEVEKARKWATETFEKYKQKVEMFRQKRLMPNQFRGFMLDQEVTKAPLQTADEEKFEDKPKPKKKTEETKHQLIKELDVLLRGETTFQATKEKEELLAHVAEKKQTIKSEEVTDEDEKETTQKRSVQNGETKKQWYRQQRKENMETLGESSLIERPHMNATCFVLRKHTEMEINGTKYVLGPILSNEDDEEENNPESSSRKEETYDAMDCEKAEDNDVGTQNR